MEQSIKSILRSADDKNKVKLNMGCYSDIKADYVNLDEKKYFEGIDVVHDLEEIPYPFEDNRFEEILARYVLDHLDRNKIGRVIDELHRICKHGALVKIQVSFEERYMRDIDHKGGFSFSSFMKLCEGRTEWRSRSRWEINKMYGIPPPGSIGRFIPNFKIYKQIGLRDYISFYIKYITNDIYVELRAIKG